MAIQPLCGRRTVHWVQPSHGRLSKSRPCSKRALPNLTHQVPPPLAAASALHQLLSFDRSVNSLKMATSSVEVFHYCCCLCMHLVFLSRNNVYTMSCPFIPSIGIAVTDSTAYPAPTQYQSNPNRDECLPSTAMLRHDQPSSCPQKVSPKCPHTVQMNCTWNRSFCSNAWDAFLLADNKYFYQ